MCVTKAVLNLIATISCSQTTKFDIQQGIYLICIEVLEPKQTVTTDYYYHQINKLNEVFLVNRHKILFHYEKEQLHTAKATQSKLQRLSWHCSMALKNDIVLFLFFFYPFFFFWFWLNFGIFMDIFEISNFGTFGAFFDNFLSETTFYTCEISERIFFSFCICLIWEMCCMPWGNWQKNQRNVGFNEKQKTFNYWFKKCPKRYGVLFQLKNKKIFWDSKNYQIVWKKLYIKVE